MKIGDKVEHHNPMFTGTVVKVDPDGYVLVDYGVVNHPHDVCGTFNSDRPVPFWEYPKPYRVWIKV